MNILKSKKNKVLITLTILIVVIVIYFFFFHSPKNNNLTKVYEDPILHFTFKYPSDLTINERKDEAVTDARVIVVSDVETGTGFQIYMTPFDEPEKKFTLERLQQELPDVIIEDPQPIVIQDTGIGIAFISGDESGQTREVWFVYKNTLYQITMPINFDEAFKKILNTWTFN